MNGVALGGLAALAVLLAAAAVRPLPRRELAAAVAVRSRPPRTGRLARRATARVIAQAYPDALDAIVLAARAGHLPVAALQAAAAHAPPPIAATFIAVAARARDGDRFADALAVLPARLGPLAAPLADSLAAADRDGLPLAPVLDRLAEEARQRRRRQADALARQLPVRMSLPLALCTLPSFVLLAIVPLLLAALSSLQR
ncbi:MAG: type II secretion system F family protein [Ilumatobacteraceae bacterium]